MEKNGNITNNIVYALDGKNPSGKTDFVTWLKTNGTNVNYKELKLEGAYMEMFKAIFTTIIDGPQVQKRKGGSKKGSSGEAGKDNTVKYHDEKVLVYDTAKMAKTTTIDWKIFWELPVESGEESLHMDAQQGIVLGNLFKTGFKTGGRTAEDVRNGTRPVERLYLVNKTDVPEEIRVLAESPYHETHTFNEYLTLSSALPCPSQP